MDSSFYASLFDTARDLLSNNSPESTTGLYSILCALYELQGLKETKNNFEKHQIHKDYKPAVSAVYLVYHTNKQSHLYEKNIVTRPMAFQTIQTFKKNCFREITKALEIIQPEQGIEWRFNNETKR